MRQNQEKEAAPPRRKISKWEWFELLKEKNIPPQWLKQQVMNFLGVCGNYDLLETFSREAGIDIPKEWQDNKTSIQQRHEIHQLVVRGEIDAAIDKVIESQSNFQEEHQDILFSLKLLKVIRLIQQEKITESIELAQKELVPLTKGKPDYITEVEKAMTLIAFKDLKNCPNHYMCEEKHLHSVASSLNEVITKPTETEYLTSLAKLQHWCQERLKQHLDFPTLDIAKHQLFE